MGDDEVNPLISTQKSSDSLTVVLHPLVLLSISDYITRHTLRHHTGPVVGALLGQQNGRAITIEHAFDVLVKSDDNGTELDTVWFTDRLEQMKLVHKDRLLELVGWYTLLPRTGPTPDVLPIHNKILSMFNESAVLLAFHPDDVLHPSVGGKLPLTLYESNSEVDDANKEATRPEDEDKEMKDGESTFKMKFRELAYTVETGEAEMISMDFIAGVGAKTAVETREKVAAVEGDIKGKRRLVIQEPETAAPAVDVLSREEEELIATLTAKSTAIQMLHSRIQLITKYLEQLPPSYLSSDGQAENDSAGGEAGGPPTTPSNTILRSIQALVNRLPLLKPSATESFDKEVLSESNDVHLVSLLNDLMQSVQDIREVGKKHHVMEQSRNARGRGNVDLGTPASSFELAGVGDIMG